MLEAIDMVNEHNPELLDVDARLNFALRSQHFIDLLAQQQVQSTRDRFKFPSNGDFKRESRIQVDAALDYAVFALQPVCDTSPLLRTELEHCMALLAFTPDQTYG